MRTIALRLTGTKSAKEQLEEMGEETENVITTQSKLRDVIKEATAVASNEFQGFDILNDNGNYKSTYEIMLGIAEVYDEILETDKKLGRNNANLLLENVAGKVRANIAASIFQNPQLLKDAYKSSQEAENSAMEENEKYMASISGHLAQLQNAYQEAWANSMNRDTINFFIDLAKAIVNVVDDVGLLGTAFTAIVGTKSIVSLQSGKGFAAIAVKGIKNLIKSIAESEDVAGTAAQTLITYGKSIGSAFSSAIPIIGGVVTAIGLIGVAIHAVIQHQEKLKREAISAASEANKEWHEQKQTLSDYVAEYEKLKNRLDSGNLSETETLEIKQQILDIQKSIVDQYGANADRIDLINGKLSEQLSIINNISKAEADRIWNSEQYQKGFNLAEEAMTAENKYSLSMNLDAANYKTPEDKSLSYIIQKYTQEIKSGRDSQSLSTYRAIVGNVMDADERILNMIEEIEALQEQNPDNKNFQKRSDDILEYLKRYRDEIKKIKEENENTYLEGLPIKLLATKGYDNYKTYTNYETSVANLESAYVSGNTKKIQEARKAFEEAEVAKNKFLSIDGNEQFALLFDSIDTSLVETKNKVYDTIEELKVASQINEDIASYEKKADSDEAARNHLKDLKDETKSTGKYTKENKKLAKALKEVVDLNMDRVDAELVFDKNAISSDAYSNALHNLMNAIGWTIDDASLLIDTLVDAGYIQGNLSDAVDAASVSYNEYASAVSTATENLSILQNVLTESDSGKGLTSTTLDQFKQAFGDDAVKALENTANGIRVNRDAIRELGEQQNESLRTTHLEALNAQYTALQKVYEGYEDALNNGDSTTPFIQQEKAIRDEIASLELLEAQWRGTSSAYQQWLNSKSSSKPQDMYSNVISGYEEVEDLIARGFWSDPTVRKYLDLV